MYNGNRSSRILKTTQHAELKQDPHSPVSASTIRIGIKPKQFRFIPYLSHLNIGVING